jgi:hypothetical protein
MIPQQSWQNYLDYKLEERESMYKSWEKPRKEVSQEPTISHDVGKISPTLMQERLVMCMKEENLNRRLAMFERLKTQVERASVPYINLMINKTRGKMEAW